MPRATAAIANKIGPLESTFFTQTHFSTSKLRLRLNYLTRRHTIVFKYKKITLHLSLPKISFEKIVKADRNKVFDIAANYKNFEKTLPQYFPSIRIRSERDNVAVVEEHVIVSGRELVMMTKHITKYPELHEVFVIGGDAKGSHIVERYESIKGGTKITVEANLKLKGPLRLAAFFGKSKVQKGFKKIMDEFAKIAEK